MQNFRIFITTITINTLRIIHLIGVFLFFFLLPDIQAQNNYIPINNISRYNYEKPINSLPNSHPSILPFFRSEFDTTAVNADSNLTMKNLNGFSDYLLQKNMFSISKNNFWLKLSPVFQYYNGFDISNKNDFSHKSIGAHIETKLDKKLFAEFTLAYNNSLFDSYSKALIDSTGVIPGFEKYNNFNGKSYDYAYSSFHLTYTPTKYFTAELGRGKNFLGHGYRSLFLSDEGANYPYVKAYVTIWKVKYIVLYNVFKDVDTDLNDGVFYDKYATTHYLSWNVGNRINLNLFESVIWRDGDSLGTRGFDVNYMNPIIFFRPVEFSLGSPDNVIMGAGGKIRIWKNMHLYSQLVLDEFKLVEIKAGNGWFANKYGIQAGFKAYDPFKIKGLFILSELNIIRPFTYSHKGSMENYGHYFQPLAHPLGANLIEPVAIIRYFKNRFYFNLLLSYALYGQNFDSVNYGQNIYLPYTYNSNEYGNTILQGMKTTFSTTDFIAGWIVNPEWKISFEAGIRLRSIESDIQSTKNTYILFGIKTNLYNFRY